jgi:uncharacterized membrane protein
MEWLNTLNSWAPVIWIALSGALLLIWYQSIKSKHRLDIKNAAVRVLRRRVVRGELSKKEFTRRKRAILSETNNFKHSKQ